MKLILILGTLLTVVFGFSLSAYLVNYKLKLTNPLFKAVSLLTLGALLTVTTFILAVFAVWPPLF